MMTISEYIFNHLKVCPEEILEIDLHTNRPDTKHILLKPSVDIDKYVANFMDIYLIKKLI